MKFSAFGTPNTYQQANVPAANPVQHESITLASGSSGILIPGLWQTIEILELIVSWQALAEEGQIWIMGPDQSNPLATVLQSIADNQVPITCYSLIVEVEDHGIRCLNNAAGGQYAVSIYYQ